MTLFLRSFSVWGCALLLCWPGLLVAQQQNAGQTALNSQLPKQTLQKLEKIVLPAWQADDKTAFMEAMLNLIQVADVAHLDEIDRYGANNGVSSLREAFCGRILRDVEQGSPPRISSLRTPAIVYINSHFMDEIDGTLKELNAHPVMQEPMELPDSWKRNEKLFWDVHVFRNRLLNTQKLAAFVFEMSEPTYLKAKRKGDQATMDLLEPVGNVPQRVMAAYKKMLENEAELRLMELERVATTLQTEKDFRTRLAAAFALTQDESHLEDFFKTFDPADLTRERLKKPGITQGVKALVETAMKYGEDVVEKAALLRTGAHWWLRGRYGMGPMAYGLLKKPEAMDSEEAMFGLYMPRERPGPVNWVTDEGEITPGVERRHFFTWAVEYRELRDASGSSEFSESQTKWHGPERIAGATRPKSKTVESFW